MTHRHTLRVRLTALYAGLFLVAGAGLLAINYALLHHSLPANQVSVQTGEDVVLRARKLLSTQAAIDNAKSRATKKRTTAVGLPANEVATLKTIAGMPAAKVAKMIRSGQIPRPVPADLLTNLPLDANRTALHQLLYQSLVALAGFAVVAAGLGWWVAGRALRPLAEITDTARRLSAQNLDQRIALEGPDDELKALADTFDEMLGRLDRAFAGQRRFVANASHELRTPLTILRTEAEVALRRPDTTPDELRATIATMNDAVDRCDRLVTSLLALATAEHGIEITEQVDLADVARQAISHAAPEAASSHIELAIDAQAAPVHGDPGLLDRLTENLVENSIRHNQPGGWVRVTTRHVGTSARLDVSNSGERITMDQVAQLFEPFRRLGRDRASATAPTPARRGVGLGLSIVASIVTAHGGHIQAEPRASGGLDVSVDLPTG